MECVMVNNVYTCCNFLVLHDSIISALEYQLYIPDSHCVTCFLPLSSQSLCDPALASLVLTFDWSKAVYNGHVQHYPCSISVGHNVYLPHLMTMLFVTSHSWQNALSG